MSKYWTYRVGSTPKGYPQVINSGYENAPDVDTFLEELQQLCDKHKLYIAHEDTHGAFIITDNAEEHHIDSDSTVRRSKK